MNGSASCEVRYDCATRTWQGPRGKEFYGPEMTLGEVTMRVLNVNANKVLQQCDITGLKLTGRQLAQQGLSIERAFKRLGLQCGDVIGVSANNTSYLTGVTIAAMLCGTPINPLHPDFDQATVKYMYDITEPKLIFCDVENYTIIKEVNEQLVTPALIYLLNGHIEGVNNVSELLTEVESVALDDYVPYPKLNGDNIAFIVCSSGTTAMPKGVTRSHRSLICNCKNPNSYTRDTVVLSFSPLYWISGTYMLLACLLNGCKRIITNQPYTVNYMLQVVSRHEVTFLFLASHQIALLSKCQSDVTTLREQLKSVQVLIGAGSKVCKTVSRRMYDLIGNMRFVVGYGMSEVGGISKNLGGPLGSEGKVMRNVELRVLDKTRMSLGINEVGIFYVRMRYKWPGYYRNPEATKRALSDDGQWLRTGDIGYIDSEGYIYIQTRDSDVFKYNNFQIYPDQIEEFVLRLPGVSEACVFGTPHEISSNLTACAVVRTPDLEGQKLTAEHVKTIVERYLSGAYHLRGGVYFVDALPKTSNDKLQRRKVFEMVRMLGLVAE